jgi:hypothetical protein
MQMKNQAEAKMIARSMPNGKKLVFYDTIYPYNKPVDKKIAKARLPEFQSANAIRFFEDWNVDLNKMTFTKTVHGIVLEKQKEYDVLMGDWGKAKFVSFSRLSFLPLNGYVPAPIPISDQAVIPNFIYRENFFTNPLVSRDQTIFTDSAKLMTMCIGICNLVQTRKLSPYYFADGAFTGAQKIPFSIRDIDSTFSNVHENVSREVLFDYNTFYETPFYYPKTGGLGFNEKWIYNPAKNDFEKQIQSIAYLSTQYVGNQESNFMLPLFFIDPPPIKDTAAIMKPEFLVAKNIQSPVMIDHTREVDEDDRRYYPQAFKNESVIDPSVRYAFVQEIINHALSGQLIVYDGVKTETALTPIRLRTKIDSLKDSAFVPIDLPTDYLLFQEIVFVEDWYFNPGTGEFYKKVHEIIFVNSDNFVDPYRIDFEKQKRVFCVKLK